MKANVSFIKDEKFKSIYLSVNYILKIVKNEVADNVLVASILEKGSKNYPSQTILDKKLSGLYDSDYGISVEKIGDLYNIEFRMECLNKKFIPQNENILPICLDILNDVIKNPRLENGHFVDSVVEREKEGLRERISQKKDDKVKYSILKCEEILCKDEPYGVYIYGNIEDVDKSTSESLYNHYLKILNESRVEIIVTGNIDDDDEALIKEKLDYDSKEINYNLELKITDEIINEKEVAEVNQALLCMGLKVANFKKEDTFKHLIYNALLGDTPSSKLFQNVREKASLAYFAKSRFYRYKGMYIINTGIYEENYEKAKTIILEQLEDIKNGKISDEEFYAAKEGMISNLKEWKDSKVLLTRIYLSNKLFFGSDKFLVGEMIEELKKVTVQDIINISKDIKLQVIYFLGGNSNEQH